MAAEFVARALVPAAPTLVSALVLAQMRTDRWSILPAFCTLLLVMAGGLVTSRDAGPSVPDWPLSYAKLMRPRGRAHSLSHSGKHCRIAHDRIDVSRCSGPNVANGCGCPGRSRAKHACLPQLFFAATVATALFTSPSWLRCPVYAAARHLSHRGGPDGYRRDTLGFIANPASLC
jgi:hypothetical protein